MKISKFLFLAIMLCGITVNAVAADLMDVYKQALKSDPKFKAARSEWLAAKEALAVSRSILLPQIVAQGSITRSRNDGSSPNFIGQKVDSTYYDNTSAYSLKLTQSIFEFGSWAKVWGAQAQAKRAQALFLAAEEDLLQRTAGAYFNVLQAKDILSYASSKRRESARLFTQAKRKYEVGLIAIVDLEDARKNYYLGTSEELKAKNDLSDQFEKLAEITKVRYTDLAPLKNSFPLLSPDPSDIEKWVEAAKKQNFEFIAARYDTIVAKENIKLQNAGHLPSVTGELGYNYTNHNNVSGTSLSSDSKVASAGVGVTLPIFQGGGVIAAAKQADYQYQGKLSVQEQTYRSVVSQTRQAYLGVLSNISKVKADIQAVKSSKAALRATEANYSVGTRTMADILVSQAQLYDAQRTFAQDEYAYINQLLALKALTGILTVEDLAKINSWLENKNNVVKPTKVMAKKKSIKNIAKSKKKTRKPKQTKSNRAKSKPTKKKNFARGDLDSSRVVVFNVDKIQRAN